MNCDIEKLENGTKLTIYDYRLSFEENTPKIIIKKREVTKSGFALEFSPGGCWVPVTEENIFKYDSRSMYSRDENKKEFFLEKCKKYLTDKYLEYKEQADFCQECLKALMEE